MLKINRTKVIGLIQLELDKFDNLISDNSIGFIDSFNALSLDDLNLEW
jgi:hypothetical protein